MVLLTKQSGGGGTGKASFCGPITLTTITDHTNGLVDISGITAVFNTSADFSGTTKEMNVTGLTSLQLLANQYTYIVADYNNGSPIMYTTTNNNIVNHSTILNIVQLYWENLDAVNELHTFYTGAYGLGLANKTAHRLIHTERFGYESGLGLSEYGTRNINIGAGKVWYDGEEIDTLAVASATNNTHFYYHQAGAWRVTKVAQYNNSQYDNGTNLVSLSAGKYAVNFVYKCVNSTDTCSYIVLGGGNYNLTQAEAAQPPVIPDVIIKQGILVGRIIVLQGASTATVIDSAFSVKFNQAPIQDHSSLSNLDFANSGHTGFLALDQTSNPQIGVGTLKFPSIESLGALYGQGGTWYHNTPAFTPNSNQTITVSANGLSLTISNVATYKDFQANMPGSKIVIDGVARILNVRTSASVMSVTEAFPSSMWNQVYDYTKFLIYVKGLVIDGTSGGVELYTANQSGGAGPATLMFGYTGGFITTTYGLNTNSGSSSADYNAYSLNVWNGWATNWSGTGVSSGTKDVGIRRSATGKLEIYDGNTNGSMRDLDLRTLYATTQLGVGQSPIAGMLISIAQTQTAITGFPAALYGGITVAPASASTAQHRGLFYDFSINPANTAGASMTPLGYYANNTGSGSIQGFTGIYSDYDWGSANTVNATTVSGISSQLRNFNGGTISNWYGATINISIAGGNITTARGIIVNPSVTSGSITNWYGIRLGALGVGDTKYGLSVGSLTNGINNYGIYIDGVSGGSSSNFALYTNSGIVRFGDKVGILTSPNEVFESNGRILISDGGGAERYGLILGNPTSGQLYSRIQSYKYGTGTGPVNLVLQDAGGYVGIGTATPTYKVDVRGLLATDGIRSAMGFDIYQVPKPTTPTAVVSSGGSIDIGAYRYSVTFVTSLGETAPTYISAQVTTTAGNQTVTLTIPTSTDNRVTARKIYRTKKNEFQYQDYLLTTIGNNTATTYVDTAADSTLTGSSGAAYFRQNNTSKMITVNGVQAMIIDPNLVTLGVNNGQNITIGGRSVFIGSGNVGQNVTSAYDNTAVGHGAMNGGYPATGGNNVAIGAYTMRAFTTAGNTTAVGGYAAFSLTTGQNNTLIGNRTGNSITTQGYNTMVGVQAGYNTAEGQNTFIGESSFYTNVNGYNCVGLGYRSGYWETGNNKLFIDNNPRANEADGRVKALIYGVFASTVAGQTLRVNANLEVGDIGTGNYAKISSSGRLSYIGTGRKQWTKYTANSVTLTNGTSTSTVSDLQTMTDGTYYTLNEASGVPGQDLIVDFVSVTAFEKCRVLGEYVGSSSHAVAIQVYNWSTSAWDTFNSMQTGFAQTTAGNVILNNYEFTVYDDTDYIGTGGNLGKVRIRFNHPMTGNPAHYTILDEVSLRQ